MEYPTRFRVTEVSDTDFTFVFSIPNGHDGKWRVWYSSDSTYRFEREDRGVRYLDLTQRGPGTPRTCGPDHRTATTSRRPWGRAKDD